MNTTCCRLFLVLSVCLGLFLTGCRAEVADRDLVLVAAAAEVTGTQVRYAHVSPNVSLQADDPSPPTAPVKLIFIHHSCGENWLADCDGGLGMALRDNNYFVSDTNYGWGPDGIGDSTDIRPLVARGSAARQRHLPGGALPRKRSALPLTRGPAGRSRRREPRSSCSSPASPTRTSGVIPTIRRRRATRCAEKTRLGYHTVANAKGDLQRPAHLLRRSSGQAVRRHHRAAAGGGEPIPNRRQRPRVQQLAGERLAGRLRARQRGGLRLLQRPDQQRRQPGRERPRVRKRQPPSLVERRSPAHPDRGQQLLGLWQWGQPSRQRQPESHRRVRAPPERLLQSLARCDGRASACRDHRAPGCPRGSAESGRIIPRTACTGIWRSTTPSTSRPLAPSSVRCRFLPGNTTIRTRVSTSDVNHYYLVEGVLAGGKGRPSNQVGGFDSRS